LPNLKQIFFAAETIVFFIETIVRGTQTLFSEAETIFFTYGAIGVWRQLGELQLYGHVRPASIHVTSRYRPRDFRFDLSLISNWIEPLLLA
jgi:hypothetical protein